jgi:GH24 family phage-related lysozyme (muramidase)
MQTSNAGLNLIKSDEGFKSHLYNCPANDASIGYGHLVHKGPVCGASSEQPFLSGIDEQQGSALLLQDVAYAEHAVAHLVTVPLTQGQYDALVSFTYNEGGRSQGPSATMHHQDWTDDTLKNAVEKMENKERFPLSHRAAAAISFS